MTETPDGNGERTVLRPTPQYGSAPSSAVTTPVPAPAEQATSPWAIPSSPGAETSTDGEAATADDGDSLGDKLKEGAASVAGVASIAAAKAVESTKKLGEALKEVTKPNPSAAAGAAGARAVRGERRTRKARLRISRIDPWSVMKTALLFGIAGGIMFVIATFVVMSVVESTGLFDAVNKAVRDVLFTQGDDSFRIEQYINTRRVTGFAALIGAVDVVIFTALSTVFAFLYNLSATMLGGLEITLAED